MKFFALILFLLISPLAREAMAFPNMVRHGYTTCVTCHFNTSGGGSLRSYGKFVAGETMGVFNSSESALPWIKKPVEDEVYAISYMGRMVQTLFDTPQLRRGDLRKMQSDIEAAIEYETWTALMTAGPRLDSAIEGEQSKSQLFIRRFYAGKQAMNYSVKVGKFFPEYGINLPNHNIPTRKGLFFNHNLEPWILQGSYFTPTFDFTAAHIRGVKNTTYEGQVGYSGTIAYKTGSMRFGVSRLYWWLPESPKESGSTSLFGTIGYESKGYTLLEVAKKKVTNLRGHDSESKLGYLESGWEVYKGLIPYINWEYTRNITTQAYASSPGVGIQMGPATHFELIGQIAKLYTDSGNGYSVYSMLNVYF